MPQFSRNVFLGFATMIDLKSTALDSLHHLNRLHDPKRLSCRNVTKTLQLCTLPSWLACDMLDLVSETLTCQKNLCSSKVQHSPQAEIDLLSKLACVVLRAPRGPPFEYGNFDGGVCVFETRLLKAFQALELSCILRLGLPELRESKL